MKIPLYAIDRSLRSAHRRSDVLLAVCRQGPVTVGRLADITGMQPTRVRWILHGRLPYYRPERSLVPMGLVRPLRNAEGRAYEASALGLRTAREIEARRREAALWALR